MHVKNDIIIYSKSWALLDPFIVVCQLLTNKSICIQISSIHIHASPLVSKLSHNTSHYSNKFAVCIVDCARQFT